MNTPEERLRRAAEELQLERNERERLAEQAESERRQSLQRRAQRASTIANKYLRRAQELRDATRMRIYLHLDYEAKGGGDPGFELRIGRHSGLLAYLGEDGWRVSVFGTNKNWTEEYASEEQLERNTDAILEPLTMFALAALTDGRDEPAPDEFGR